MSSMEEETATPQYIAIANVANSFTDDMWDGVSRKEAVSAELLNQLTALGRTGNAPETAQLILTAFRNRRTLLPYFNTCIAETAVQFVNSLPTTDRKQQIIQAIRTDADGNPEIYTQFTGLLGPCQTTSSMPQITRLRRARESDDDDDAARPAKKRGRSRSPSPTKSLPHHAASADALEEEVQELRSQISDITGMNITESSSTLTGTQFAKDWRAIKCDIQRFQNQIGIQRTGDTDTLFTKMEDIEGKLQKLEQVIGDPKHGTPENSAFDWIFHLHDKGKQTKALLGERDGPTEDSVIARLNKLEATPASHAPAAAPAAPDLSATVSKLQLQLTGPTGNAGIKATVDQLGKRIINLEKKVEELVTKTEDTVRTLKEQAEANARDIAALKKENTSQAQDISNLIIASTGHRDSITTLTHATSNQTEINDKIAKAIQHLLHTCKLDSWARSFEELIQPRNAGSVAEPPTTAGSGTGSSTDPPASAANAGTHTPPPAAGAGAVPAPATTTDPDDNSAKPSSATAAVRTIEASSTALEHYRALKR